MVLKNTVTSLADKIYSVIGAPSDSIHPDNFDLDETSAKLVTCENSEVNADQSYSKLRHANATLPSEADGVYAGRTVSRKRLREDSFSDDSDLEVPSGHGDDMVDDSDGDSSAANDEQESKDMLEDTAHNDEQPFKHLDNVSKGNLDKAQSVRNQISLWVQLLEIRIQIQKCLTNANRIAQNEVLNELSRHSQFSALQTHTKRSLENVLRKMLRLDNTLNPNLLLSNNHHHHKNVNASGDNEEIPSDNEEIPSSDEEIPKNNEKIENHAEEISSEIDEMSSNEEENEKNCSSTIDKQHSLNFKQELQKRFELQKKEWSNIIQKWYEKTRLDAGRSSSATAPSILSQIEYALRDEQKLLLKTQTKKSHYEISGESNNDKDGVNLNIYDDDDFYHELLRELIEVKSADLTDPMQISKQWVQLHNYRTKMKRKVDTRATKGRKIRYAVHSKLVNFMAPLDRQESWPDSARDDLFASLFR